MVSVKVHEALRTCNICGKEALVLDDLEGFKLDKRGSYGRANLCKPCESMYQEHTFVKTCSQCERELPLTMFWRDNTKVGDKHRAYCKNCGKNYDNSKEYWDKHNQLPHVKKYKREWAKLHAVNTRLLALRQLAHPKEPTCSICGFDDFRALSIDHINNDGYKEKKSAQRKKNYKFIINNPEEAKEKFQILCRNHNWIKRIEHGEVKYNV